MNEYLTETELAKRLKVSRYVLWTLRKTGLPYRRVRGAILFVPEEVDAWLDVHCKGTAASKPTNGD